MKDYLALSSRYLKAHKKKSRLTIISVAISVALITGIFSMLDVFVQFETVQIIHDYGNYHLALIDPSAQEMQIIDSRVDVKNTGRWQDFGIARINDISCRMGALDARFAPNMNMKMLQGAFPAAANEIILEEWAANSQQLNLKVGDRITTTLSDGTKRDFVISGTFEDLGHMKAKGTPAVMLSPAGADTLQCAKKDFYFIEFKNRVNILKAEKEIKGALNLDDNRLARNDRLLAIMGQNDKESAISLYMTGAVLFAMVLIAGVVMIYNTFNISVMERVRQFGLLRCIGASPAQIKKLVRREGLIITFKAIPFGCLVGMGMALFCCALLKYYNTSLFGDISLFNFSPSGIAAGISIGFLTVFMASHGPARRAARVSPVNAVTGSNEIKTSQKMKQGLLTRLFPIETALGINNAVLKKRTLVLMASSIALSIILFLGFQVFVDFMYKSLKTTKPYTPDISLISEKGLSGDLYARLAGLEGVDKIYGRMFADVEATFDAGRLTDAYRQEVPEATTRENGLFYSPESSWLISYDKNQLQWARDDLIDGELSEQKMNEQNGIIATVFTNRKGVGTETAQLKVGDKVIINTPPGAREYTIMGILRSVPFSDSTLHAATFITTEKLFNDITGQAVYQSLDLQLKKQNQEETVKQIKLILNPDINFLDSRQQNAEMNQTFITFAIFVYGFLAVIALISIINIINTMNTSVAAKIRYLGLMRAIGMAGPQLKKMVLVESATYSLTGLAVGCVLGLILQRWLVQSGMAPFHMAWHFPGLQIIGVAVFTGLITIISVHGPIKRIKNMPVTELVGSL